MKTEMPKGQMRMKSRSTTVAVALMALSFSGLAFAARKVERTTKAPKVGSTCIAAEKTCISGAGAGCTTQDCKDGKLDACTTEYNKCVDANPAEKATSPPPPPVANKKAVRKTEQECQAEQDRCIKVLCATSTGGAKLECEINCTLGLDKCRKNSGVTN